MTCKRVCGDAEVWVTAVTFTTTTVLLLLLLLLPRQEHHVAGAKEAVKLKRSS